MAQVDNSQTIAIVCLTTLLGITGVGTFVWMAATNWEDKTGIGVGIIFVSLTVLQAIFTVFWWKSNKTVAERTQDPEPAELKCVTPGRRVSADRIAQNQMRQDSPLLHRSNGQTDNVAQA